MKKRILITGAAGYLGSVLYPILKKKYDVVGMDNFLYHQEHSEDIIEADITSLTDMYNLTKGIDVVVALAGIVGDPACGLNPEETKIVNLESTKLLVDACETNKVKRIMFASTCSIYAKKPLSLYAQTKYDSENILLKRCNKCKPVILRFGTLFGYSPRMRFDLVVNIMTAMALKERKIIVNGGDQWRPLVHIKDVSHFIFNLIENENILFNFYNFVNIIKDNFQIKSIAKIISNLTSAKIFEKKEIIDGRNYKPKVELDFNTSLEQGVKEIIEHFKKGEFEDYKDKKYYNAAILKTL